ncbi:LacI family DNA-binding transcriptional regulator [Mucilaginibacter sp. Bleaf8]|nr:LacI family DNA-binding transcriptional regulator [Mucilaginibacter sp. Bleaf8]
MHFEVITIRDIARELGLSVSTVSKALRDSHEISSKTKLLVQDYAREHNYRPNPIAQSLKQGQSKSIGVVVPAINNQFFSQVIDGIESVAYSNGYNVIITQTHERYDMEVQNVEHLVHRSIDGLLISLCTETQNVEHLQKLHRQGLPIVFFDRVSNDIETHKVIADNYKGAYDATSHLLETGYKDIAHITSTANASVTTERLAGYKQALADADVAVQNDYIKFCPNGTDLTAKVETALDELLALNTPPQALFTAWDTITTTVLALLHKRGLRVPQDIALVGFSNTTLADILNPSLTAVHQPGFEMGKTAIEMLLALIKAKYPIEEFETKVLPTQLFVRASSVKA